MCRALSSSLLVHSSTMAFTMHTSSQTALAGKASRRASVPQGSVCPAQTQRSCVASCSAIISSRQELASCPSVAPRSQRVNGRGSALRTSATEFVGAVTSQPDWKYGVVVARFNSLVTKQLLEGAHEVFARHGVPSANVDVAWVPGSFELPVVAQSMAASGQYSAIVCIGAVIQGATTHYDAVVGAATSGVLSASTNTGVPVVFGVLTTDNLEQALDRSGGKVGNKGGEAALTAIEMASLMHQLRKVGKAAPPSNKA